MFEFPLFAEEPLWYAGLIWALVMGWAASSYASNFAYRIPRGETPFGREPYCGDCNATLTPRDLFPIFSYLATGGKCRHCGATVPCSYFLLELLYAPYVGLCYIMFGFGDMFLLLASLGMLLQIMAMMAWDDNHVSATASVMLLAGGMMFRLLEGGLLIDALLGSFFGLFGALILYGLIYRKPVPKDVYALPKWVWVLAACGSWLNLLTIHAFIVSWVVIVLLGRTLKADKPWLVIAPAPALLIAVWWGLFP